MPTSTWIGNRSIYQRIKALARWIGKGALPRQSEGIVRNRPNLCQQCLPLNGAQQDIIRSQLSSTHTSVNMNAIRSSAILEYTGLCTAVSA